MNLDAVAALLRPRSIDDVTAWDPGCAWLAGGTWLFSEPQPGTTTLVDLAGLGWPALTVAEDGLTIAATCRIAELFRFDGPAEWHALPLVRACCNDFLAGFKIWNSATVGGNLCLSLPAGPMISLTAALDGVCTLWPRGGPPRTLPVVDFITGNHANGLAAGELLRSIHLPAAALRRRCATRHTSLTKLGRSAALIVGTSGPANDLLLTITAATDRPVQFRFAAMPSAPDLRDAIASIPADRWFDDVHGSAPYKRHITSYLSEQIREELAHGS